MARKWIKVVRGPDSLVRLCAEESVGKLLGAMTPINNMGSTVTEVGGSFTGIKFHIDSLNFSVWCDLQLLMELVAHHLFRIKDFGGFLRTFKVIEGGSKRGFRKMHLGQGITFYSDPIQGAGFCSVEVKGEGMSLVTADGQIALFAEVDHLGYRWQSSRGDPAWDGVPFTPQQCDRAARSGNIKTTVHRRSGWIRWVDKPAGEPDQDAEYAAHCAAKGVEVKEKPGQTFYLGHRTGERMLRVYNMRGPVRCELEMRGERWDAVYKRMLKMPGAEWSHWALVNLLDFVDFVSVDSDSNAARRSRLRWWSEFVGEAKRAQLLSPKSVRQMASTGRAKRKRAFRVVYIQEKVLGADWMSTEWARYRREFDGDAAVQVEVARLRLEYDMCVDECGVDVARGDFGEQVPLPFDDAEVRYGMVLTE